MKKSFVLIFVIIFMYIFSQSLTVGNDDKLIIKINVWGQVQRPGQYDVEYNSSLIVAISKAGGFNDYANLKKIKIVRIIDGKKKIIPVNIKKYLKNPDNIELPTLKNGDIIYVEKNVKKDWTNFVTFISQIAIIINVIYLITKG